MSEDQIYDLMMAALDDELDDLDSAELDRQLADHPDLAQEWQGILFIDSLLSNAPPVLAPVNLAERTLARLPNPRYRRIFMASVFALLLLLGLIPVIGAVYAYGQIDGGNLVGGLAASGAQYLSFIRVVTAAIVTGLNTVATEQPWLFAWLFLMVAIIYAWQNFYTYLTAPIVLGNRN